MASNELTAARCAILCYGDSNTHGTRAMRYPGERRRYRGHVRWPGRLAGALDGVAKVIEAGLPGRTTVHDDPVEGAHKNGLAVLPAVLESHAPLDVVILMLGTNDLKARFAVGPLEVAQSAERLVLAIAGSRCGPEGTAPGVLLVAPVPILETGFFAEIFAGGADKSRRLAGTMQDVAARQGCGFLDAGRVASVHPDDGIHLGEADHAALADALAGQLLQVLS